MNNEILKFALNQEDEIIKHSTIPFNRIDEWHSITGLSEITTDDIPSDWKLIDETPLLKHDSFPANQDAVNMVTWVDDHYTYIMNQVHCFDNHAGPQLMGFVLRLDKEEYTGKAVK